MQLSSCIRVGIALPIAGLRGCRYAVLLQQRLLIVMCSLP